MVGCVRGGEVRGKSLLDVAWAHRVRQAHSQQHTQQESAEHTVSHAICMRVRVGVWVCGCVGVGACDTAPARGATLRACVRACVRLRMWVWVKRLRLNALTRVCLGGWVGVLRLLLTPHDLAH